MINVFTSLCDYWIVVDNLVEPIAAIAEGVKNIESLVYNEQVWKQIKDSAHEIK